MLTLQKLNELFAVFLALIGLTFMIWLTDADRIVASLFYAPEMHWIWQENDRWTGRENELLFIIYKLASFPAFAMGGVALLILISGYKLKVCKILRKQALFILFFLILGPGLIVNVLLKDNIGRARPHEIVEFRGEHSFTPFWKPGDSGANSSFPSGHAAIAFASMGPWFLIRRRNRGDEYQLLLAASGWGLVVGAARIIQGGHFLSDVIWAGGLVFITGQVLSLLMQPELEEQFFREPWTYLKNS
jgi:membrane-associated PAP2 superfamily phosphatase